MSDENETSDVEEKPVLKVLEKNRILVIPEAYYAGGMYRTHADLRVKEWERIHYLYASDIEIKK
jgi:hypothetical protein